MNYIKLLIIWFQLYSVEITKKGGEECLLCVTDKATRLRIYESISLCESDKHRLEGKRNEILLNINKWRVV